VLAFAGPISPSKTMTKTRRYIIPIPQIAEWVAHSPTD
jgi:hypothetical protein